MKAINRRDFLRGGFLGAGTAPRPSSEGGAPPVPPGRAPEGRLPIGRLADFPVGEVRRLEHLGLAIESLPEGLRARSLGLPAAYCAISAGPAGELLASREEPWPRDWVFSTLINGPTGLDIGMEEDG